MNLAWAALDTQLPCRHLKGLHVPLLQDEPRDHPAGGDGVPPLKWFTNWDMMIPYFWRTARWLHSGRSRDRDAQPSGAIGGEASAGMPERHWAEWFKSLGCCPRRALSERPVRRTPRDRPTGRDGPSLAPRRSGAAEPIAGERQCLAAARHEESLADCPPSRPRSRQRHRCGGASGPLLPFGSASALLRSGHSSLPQRNRQGSVGRRATRRSPVQVGPDQPPSII